MLKVINNLPCAIHVLRQRVGNDGGTQSLGMSKSTVLGAESQCMVDL